MKWLRKKPKQYPWEPVWTYAVNGMFWRIKISEDGLILCEIRDPETKTAWFNCIREKNGAIHWQDLRFDEPWWIGIEDISAGRAYFHTFRKPDMPQHAGITAVDMTEGTILWNNPDFTFLFVDGDDVYATKQGFEARTFYLLDHATGTVARELGLDIETVNKLRASQNEEYIFRNYRYPSNFDEIHSEYEQLRELIYAHVNLNHLRGNLDVLKARGLAIVSWHEITTGLEEHSPLLDQRFIAIEIDSNSLIYADTINSGVQAPSVDSFFVKDDLVFYIKNKQILTAHTLPAE